jgi:N-acetyl-D-muramate 6-phosphate phosphatase
MSRAPSKVLFDLDGTLLDTAPGLAWALNRVRTAQGLPALAFDRVRSQVSHGSVALTRIGCDADEGSEEFERFRLALLRTYGDNVAYGTRLFEGMEELLHALESRSIPWGVVTNKPDWLTGPLLQALGLGTRAAVIISGDTAQERKPHPAPLLLAAERMATSPRECVYVGDAKRDITAGKAAGMYTLVALYGYIGADDSPTTWGADAMVRTPLEIGRWLTSF